jgi:phospholipase/carboxylesterase
MMNAKGGREDKRRDPHGGQPVLAAGTPLERARWAVVMVHGRGATAESILELAHELAQPGLAYLAPQAAGGTWYPYRFLEPIERNEPYLTSALGWLGALLGQTAAAGVPPERTVLLGFSQGACLALEYAARNARRYGGLVGFSGGLIGPDSTPRDYAGSFAGTPAFLGCSDVDFHIPKERVEDTAAVLGRMGAVVTVRLYPNMGHTVNADELAVARSIIATLV